MEIILEQQSTTNTKKVSGDVMYFTPGLDDGETLFFESTLYLQVMDAEIEAGDMKDTLSLQHTEATTYTQTYEDEVSLGNVLGDIEKSEHDAIANTSNTSVEVALKV